MEKLYFWHGTFIILTTENFLFRPFQIYNLSHGKLTAYTYKFLHRYGNFYRIHYHKFLFIFFGTWQKNQYNMVKQIIHHGTNLFSFAMDHGKLAISCRVVFQKHCLLVFIHHVSFRKFAKIVQNFCFTFFPCAREYLELLLWSYCNVIIFDPWNMAICENEWDLGWQFSVIDAKCNNYDVLEDGIHLHTYIRLVAKILNPGLRV